MRTRPTLLLLAATTFAFAARTDDTVLLRRVLTEGDTVSYLTTIDVAQQMTVPGMGDQDLTVKGSTGVTVKVGKVDKENGTALVETTTTVNKMEMGGSISGMVPPMSDVKPIVQKGTITVRNRFTVDPTTVPGAGMMQMMSGGNQSAVSQFIDFPEGPVKIGDTWDVIIAKGLMTYPEDQKLTATFKGEKDADGTPAWVVTITGTFLSKIDSSKIPGAQENPMGSIKVDGKSSLTAEVALEKATGKMISMTATIKSKTKTAIGDSITIESDGTTKTETKIVK
jgi:hypothetical protein